MIINRFVLMPIFSTILILLCLFVTEKVFAEEDVTKNSMYGRFSFGYVPDVYGNNYINDGINSYNSAYSRNYDGVGLAGDVGLSILLSDYFAISLAYQIGGGADSIEGNGELLFSQSIYSLGIEILLSGFTHKGWFLRTEIGYADLSISLDGVRRKLPGTAGQITIGYSVCFGDYHFKSIFLSSSYMNISTHDGTVSYPTIQLGLTY